MRTPAYTVQKIEPLPGDDAVIATALNNYGQVVGHSVKKDVLKRPPSRYGVPEEGTACYWQAGDSVPLKGFGSYTYALAINDRGDIVGGAWEKRRLGLRENDEDVAHWPVVWPALEATFLIGGQRTHGKPDVAPLRLPGGDDGVARGINEKREIVGSCPGPTLWSPDDQWHVTLKGIAAPKPMRLVGINSRQEMIAYSSIFMSEPNYGESSQQAFWWQGGRWRPLGGSSRDGEVTSKPYDLTETGLVVGWVGTKKLEYEPVPYLWKQGKGEPLSKHKGGARGVNEAGVIVGWCADDRAKRFACVWQTGKPLDLNSSAPAGVRFTSAVGVNNRGHVLVNSDGGDAYLLSPK